MLEGRKPGRDNANAPFKRADLASEAGDLRLERVFRPSRCGDLSVEHCDPRVNLVLPLVDVVGAYRRCGDECDDDDPEQGTPDHWKELRRLVGRPCGRIV